MNHEQIRAEIDAIKAARLEKGGRTSNEEKAQIEHLAAMLEIPETTEEPMSETTDETASEEAEEPEEAPRLPTGMVRVEILCDNISVPHRESTVHAFQGEIHDVPESFLEIAGDRVCVISGN